MALPELMILRVREIPGNDDDVVLCIHMRQEGAKRPNHRHWVKVPKDVLRPLARYMLEDLGPEPPDPPLTPEPSSATTHPASATRTQCALFDFGDGNFELGAAGAVSLFEQCGADGGKDFPVFFQSINVPVRYTAAQVAVN
jgi:hypothetical protein